MSTEDPIEVPDREWELHARWWQENFTEGADPEYSELIIPMLVEHLGGLCRGPTAPSGTRGSHPRVLDVGTGEGQVGRAISASSDATVLGCDLAWGQLQEARRRAGGPTYMRAAATRLPLQEGSVDAVVACLLLEHVADLDAALQEAARVLRSDGRLLVVINHPIVATPGSGWIDDHMVEPPEQYWQLGPYLSETVARETVAQGVQITFHHRILSRYINAARAVGLVLAHMDEPAPPPGFVALAPEYSEQLTMPRMMMLRFDRL